MTFSFYQSLKTVPRDLDEASRSFRFSGWQRFWRLEVPFAMPGLVWNTMMSMSGGWFFVVASEAITVGNTTIALPGIGSYVARAIKDQNLAAIGWAVLAMLLVIILYDQLLFRPLVAWSDKFRVRTFSQRDGAALLASRGHPANTNSLGSSCNLSASCLRVFPDSASRCRTLRCPGSGNSRPVRGLIGPGWQLS